MAKAPETLSREERLAAKLRENLRRRKAQMREAPREVPPTGSDPGQPESSDTP